MKTSVLIFAACLPALLGHAQKSLVPKIPGTGRRVADFVPAGYGILERSYATGDLNRDGCPDVALVLTSIREDTLHITEANDKMPPRQLLVLLATPIGYALAAQAGRAVLCRACGGMGNDPFVSLTIQKGTLALRHYSSSNWFRRNVARFRYQQGAFYLIGETIDSGRTGGDCAQRNGPAGWDYRDTNFVTGEYEVEKLSENCQLLLKKHGRNKPILLRKLADYRPGE